MASVKPYQFEPDCSNERDSNNFTENNDFEINMDNRRGKLNWCKCGQCVVMTTDQESVCCRESEKVKQVSGIACCVTNNVLFNKLVLDKDVLNISRHKMILKSKKKQKKKVLCKSEPQNKVWRYLAYKQFISWINAWTTIGKENRIVIPSCVIYKIRQTYPEENGVYVGFRPNDKLPT